MNSKQKGNAFEREMAARFRADLFPKCYTSRFMGSVWADYNGIDLTGTPGFNIQCKAVEKLSPGYHEILAKMLQNKNKNIVVHKKNNKGITVTMFYDDFVKLMKRLK